MGFWYLAIGIFVGLLVILDGYLLLKTKNDGQYSNLINVTTTIEFIWAIVSVITMFALEFSALQIMSPLLFASHNIFGWLYGFYIVANTPKEKIDLVKIVPSWYAVFGLSVGIVYTTLNIFLLLGLGT
ncbi:hypothetical protein BM527_09005 [Alteromonas sp. Mex14]|nr:hypothetical protein BM527_09005 [Alteromonas sp. Mex14]